MGKQLLVDYTLFEISPRQITESLSKNGGRLVVSGVLQRAEAKNQNGRVYPKETLMREAKKYSDSFVQERRALGELDHPESSVVNLNNVSHNVLGMDWKGDDLVGNTIEVQPDFELIAFDFVSNPSTHGAFLSPVNESIHKVVTEKYSNINNIITNIITEF